MKVSVVTISFNQASFLRQCIESVLAQRSDANLEFIVVDPGSTDGSREIISSYGAALTCVFENDAGPADGLNRGFARATGDVYCYLNSDDVLHGRALSRALGALARTGADVIHGHGHVIDESGTFRRKLFSDRFDLRAAAHGHCVLIQPSSFFRRSSFERAGGFNVSNRSNWDGELFIDMALSGSEFALVDEFFSSYRVHGESITGSGKLAQMHSEYRKRMFEKITGDPFGTRSKVIGSAFKWRRRLLNYRDSIERMIRGPVFGSSSQ